MDPGDSTSIQPSTPRVSPRIGVTPICGDQPDGDSESHERDRRRLLRGEIITLADKSPHRSAARGGGRLAAWPTASPGRAWMSASTAASLTAQPSSDRRFRRGRALSRGRPASVTAVSRRSSVSSDGNCARAGRSSSPNRVPPSLRVDSSGLGPSAASPAPVTREPYRIRVRRFRAPGDGRAPGRSRPARGGQRSPGRGGGRGGRTRTRSGARWGRSARTRPCCCAPAEAEEGELPEPPARARVASPAAQLMKSSSETRSAARSSSSGEMVVRDAGVSQLDGEPEGSCATAGKQAAEGEELDRPIHDLAPERAEHRDRPGLAEPGRAGPPVLDDRVAGAGDQQREQGDGDHDASPAPADDREGGCRMISVHVPSPNRQRVGLESIGTMLEPTPGCGRGLDR